MCCPSAEIKFLEKGIDIHERPYDTKDVVCQFIPFRAIQSVRFSYSRDDREAILTVWVLGQGSPGAGGLAYRWRLRCEESSRAVYEKLIAAIS